jgi:hypothetical protein
VAKKISPQITQITLIFKKEAHELHELSRINQKLFINKQKFLQGDWISESVGQWVRR